VEEAEVAVAVLEEMELLEEEALVVALTDQVVLEFLEKEIVAVQVVGLVARQVMVTAAVEAEKVVLEVMVHQEIKVPQVVMVQAQQMSMKLEVIKLMLTVVLEHQEDQIGLTEVQH
jgi:hypothetical protein